MSDLARKYCTDEDCRVCGKIKPPPMGAFDVLSTGDVVVTGMDGSMVKITYQEVQGLAEAARNQRELV